MALASSTTVHRTVTESGVQQRVLADALLLVTFRRGHRNVVGNAIGQGEGREVTVAVELPDAVRFFVSPAQIRRHPAWFATVPGLTVPAQTPPSVPLPRRFIASREVGLGSVHPDMLSHPHSALAAVAITFIWGMFGTNLIIFLAGMSTIDVSLYEAARVDGAGPLRVLVSITLPLLRRFVQFAFIITLISAFTAIFSLIYIMTGGGPGFATTTLEFYGYQQGFATGDFGAAATAGVMLFVAVAVVSVVQVRLFRGAEE